MSCPCFYWFRVLRLRATRGCWPLPLLFPQKQRIFAWLPWQVGESPLLPLRKGKQVLFLPRLWEQEGLVPLSPQLKEGFASFGRRVWEAAGFFTPVHQRQLSHHHTRATEWCCPTPVTLVGTGWRPAQTCLRVSADSCCVRGCWLSQTEGLACTQPSRTC